MTKSQITRKIRRAVLSGNIEIAANVGAELYLQGLQDGIVATTTAAELYREKSRTKADLCCNTIEHMAEALDHEKQRLGGRK